MLHKLFLPSSSTRIQDVSDRSRVRDVLQAHLCVIFAQLDVMKNKRQGRELGRLF